MVKSNYNTIVLVANMWNFITGGLAGMSATATVFENVTIDSTT